jgi:hypothetical protein
MFVIKVLSQWEELCETMKILRITGVWAEN